MLRKNPLQPPRPFSAARQVPANGDDDGLGRGFVTPEDFDRTGILTGMDPSEPRYWWIPELHGHADAAGPLAPSADQATSRAGSRTVAAA
jgi:hypothetical protein